MNLKCSISIVDLLKTPALKPELHHEIVVMIWIAQHWLWINNWWKIILKVVEEHDITECCSLQSRLSVQLKS